MYKFCLLTLIIGSLHFNTFGQKVFKWYEKGKIEKIHKYINNNGDIMISSVRYHYNQPDTLIIDTLDLLGAASFYGDIKTINHIIKNKNSIVNYQISINKALGHATRMCHTEIAKLLIKEGANVFNRCSYCWDRNLIQISIVQCPELISIYDSLKVPYTPYDIKNWSPLHMAVYSGNLENVKKMINMGFDINEVTTEGHSTLTLACMILNIEITKFLIDKGADINILDNEGHNLLWYCNEKNHPVTQYLNSKGLVEEK